MTRALPLVGEDFAGYRLRAVLGRGGMSVVYQAENPRLSNIVALKVIAPELATEDSFRARFLQESRIAASLNHPNVIPVYDMGPCGDLLYIAMRYVAGADLRAVLKAHGRLSCAQALLLLGQAGRALDAAHRAGVIHRDVKPANLLIERGADDDPDHVYLADFGVTKHQTSRSGLTDTGHFVGTLAYVAPEEIQGRAVDARADIYSLGCVMYESLTGRVPFPKEIDAAVIWAHVEEDPPAPSGVCPDLPRALDDVIARALAKEPDDRYGNCRQLIDAAKAALEAAPAREPQSSVGVADTVLAGVESMRKHPRTPTGAQARSGAGGQVPIGPPVSVESPAAPRADASPPPVEGSPSSAAPQSAAPPGTPAAPDKRRPRRALLPALGILVLLVAAGIAVWLTTAGTSSSKSATHASSSRMNPIQQALSHANSDPGSLARNRIPPSTCKSFGAAKVTCSKPYPNVYTATFTTYSTLPALYGAYKDQLNRLGDTRGFDWGTCGPNRSGLDLAAGESGWNHAEQHPRKYTLKAAEAGNLNSEDQLAGRVFCAVPQNAEYIVWTQNDGRLLGVVSGPIHDVYSWWYPVHHEIDLGSGSSMNMSGSGSNKKMSGMSGS